MSKNDFREKVSCISVVSLEVVEIKGPKKRCVKSVHPLNQAPKTIENQRFARDVDGIRASIIRSNCVKVLETVDDFREKERRFQKYRVTLLVN